MKQLFTFVLLVFAVSFGFSQSKSPNVDFQIPNGGFENWYNVVINPSVSYDEIGTGPTDNWLGTLNSLAAVPPTAGGPGPVTIFKTTDKHSGTYAAQAVSADFPLGPATIFIPGMIGTAVMDNANVRALMGKPCQDCKPSKLKGYFKFQPVNNDSCAAVILLSRWNATTKKRDTVGYGKMVQRTAVTEYTAFEVPVNYREAGSVDTMTMLVVSSAGFNVVNFMGSVGQVGNTMFVDDLTLDYPSGVQQVLMPEVSVSVYPNPATDVLHVDMSKMVKNGRLEVFNGSGKMVASFEMAQMSNRISVANLLNGNYYYRLVSGKELINTGSFVIQK